MAKYNNQTAQGQGLNNFIARCIIIDSNKSNFCEIHEK
jgi:hypothetical protein